MVEEGVEISSWEDARKVDGNLSSGLEIITNILRSNDSFSPIKYRPIRINTRFFWLRVTVSLLKEGISLIAFIFSSFLFFFPHETTGPRGKTLFYSAPRD